MEQKLISFDLKAEFGFFKKPDINDGIYLTYNMLHKPALLGILGAIIGLKGYEKNGVLPEYYTKLKDIKLSIQPLGSDKGNFTKDILSYNNSSGFASDEQGGNLIVTEQILIKPSYRCFLLLNFENELEKQLYENIMSYKAEFLPYMGKNDFSAWWTNCQKYDDIYKFDFNTDYRINSIFAKYEAVSSHISIAFGRSARLNEQPFVYFEKLPIAFDEDLYQYKFGDFVYSNAFFSKEMNMSSYGIFYKIDNEIIIQLF